MRFHKNIFVTALLFMLMLFCSLQGFSQTTTQNFVLKLVPNKAINTDAKLTTLSANKDSVRTMIQYLDGFGRPLQTVIEKGSPLGKDIIQPFAYDAKGRQDKQYLPYVNTSTSYGTYRSDALTTGAGVQAFYNPTGATLSADGKQTNGIVLTQYPYTQTGFEASPLNRVIEQGAPGKSWVLPGTPNASSSNHTKRIAYATNDLATFSTLNTTSNDGSRKVQLYTAQINPNGSRTLLRKGDTARYMPGLLSVTIIRDENWQPSDRCFGTTEEYRDKEGRMVLKRTYNVNRSNTNPAAEQLSTYYVYDDLGNLSFVLPPLSNADLVTPNQTTIDDQCYQYRYDSRNRVFQKKIPGKGWQFVIYNKLNQVIATQDSTQRMKAPQEWTISKYDALGRAVLTGVYQHTGSTAGVDMHTTIQSIADTTSKQWEDRLSTSANGYTALTWPKVWTTTLNITYYDTYTGIPGLPTAYDKHTDTTYSTQTLGMVTATKTQVLNTTADYLWTVPYYDGNGNVIKLFSQHYLGGASAMNQFNLDDVTTTYDFLNRPNVVTRRHYVATTPTATTGTQRLMVFDTYTYDHMGRSRIVYNQLKDKTSPSQAKIILAQKNYNEIGQVYQKGVHSINSAVNFLQVLDYRYNARGWLTNINNPGLTADTGRTNSDTNDQFGLELKYDDNSLTAKQYNGNIAWSKAGTGVSGSLPLIYDYTYDRLNRLTAAVSTTTTAKDGFYNEGIQYNLAGDIQKLNRNEKDPTQGKVTMDSLLYTYSHNKLLQVMDRSTYAGNAGFKGAGLSSAYTYDANGNLKKDLNKTISSIAYNILNLPQTITWANGNILTYIYDAAGRKLRKLFASGGNTTVTEYVNGIEYDNFVSNATSDLTFIQTAEGRARRSGSKYVYEYDLKDNLGNTRLTLTYDNVDSVLQRNPKNLQKNEYYAFGYSIQSLSTVASGSKNEYLYNGKELQEETGLYDYGARLYDPVLGRWNSVDPMAETSRRWSPYNYVYNNPVNLTDPDGMEADTSIVGADGLTNDQWRQSSSPYADPGMAEQFRQDNYQRGQESRKQQAEDAKNTAQDPYAYAGNLIHLPGDKLPLDDGKDKQEYNTCVFYSMAAASAFYGVKVNGLDLLYNTKMDGRLINDLEIAAVLSFGLKNSLLESVYRQKFSGYFIGNDPVTAISTIAFGYPILGIYRVGVRATHQVFITGVSSIGSVTNYTFWNPATSRYDSRPTSDFLKTFAVTGILQP